MTLEEIKEGKVFLVDKPLEWSSFQAVNKLKWLILRNFKIKKIKIGHAGTLDPLATGLLVVCAGKQTKSIPQYQGQEKEYTGTITLGATTPSYDMETEVDAHFPTAHIDEEMLRATTEQFTGDILQKPPIFSAIRKDGKRLYELARKGVDTEIAPRQVAVHEFELTRIALPEVDFRVRCSKGTYIRSLAYDFGKALNSGAYLSALRRTKIGDFDVANALKPEDFESILRPDDPQGQ